MTDMNSQIQGIQQVPNRINKKKATSKYTYTTEGQSKQILKAATKTKRSPKAR